MMIDFDTTFYFHREGAGLLFGMGDPSERPGFDTSVKWDFLPAVTEVAMRRLPALADAAISHAWAGLYEMTPDHNPVIGACGLDGVERRDAPDPDTIRDRPTANGLVVVREVTPTRITQGEIRHSDRMWVRTTHPLPDDPLLHACAVAYVSDFGSGFGQIEVPGIPVGGPSIDHAVWFHEPIRADEWMLLELAPTKALASRGTYRGAITGVDGRLGAVLAQELLLRDLQLDAETLRRVAEYLGAEE